MVGKIDFDETKLAYITAWVPGRLDCVFVDYTGVPVRKGDHIELYSPELLSAQEELLAGIKAVKELKDSDVAVVRESTLNMVKAACEKLRLWGLEPEQIRAIETSAKASDHITIRAPSGGIVIHKNAQQGMYVKTGDRIYTIADLNSVWVDLRAYESDLMWLRYGQKVDMGIVICENILRHLDEADPSESRIEVIHRAGVEVGGAVVTAMMTTIVGFLPVLLMTGERGKLFRPLAYTKSFALLAAVVVSLTIIPPAAHVLFCGRISGKLMKRCVHAIVAAVGVVAGVMLAW